MKFYLIVAKGTKKGLAIPINVDLFLLGSDKMCQLRAANLGAKQCAFVTRENKVFIRDFNSGEPTMVNESLLPPGEEWPLHAGDRIAVGNLDFMIEFREKALSGRDLEEWASSCLDKSEKRNILDEADEGLKKMSNASDAAAQIMDKLSAMKGRIQGRLRIGREQGVVIVKFNDTMLVEESEIVHVKKELTENLNRPNLRILLDLKNVRRMSTNAITMLMEFSRWIKPFGSSIAMCRIRPEMREMMDTMRMLNVPIFADKSSAFSAKW